MQLEPAPMVIDVSLGPARNQCDPSIVHVGSSQDPKIRSVRQEELTAIAPTLWRVQTTVNI
jgi:hypothetical protein